VLHVDRVRKRSPSDGQPDDWIDWGRLTLQSDSELESAHASDMEIDLGAETSGIMRLGTRVGAAAGSALLGADAPRIKDTSITEIDSALTEGQDDPAKKRLLTDKLSSLKARLAGGPSSHATQEGKRPIGQLLIDRAREYKDAKGAAKPGALASSTLPGLVGSTPGRSSSAQREEAVSSLLNLVGEGKGDTTDYENPVFHLGSPHQTQDISEIAARHPGLLLSNALQEIGKYLQTRSGPANGETEVGRVLTYVMTVYMQRFTSQEIGIRNLRELRTLAEALDALLEGNLARVGDLLVQRLKAIEMAVFDGNWNLARHLELIPPQEVTLVSVPEKAQAAKVELQRVKLLEASKKTKE
jgi:hypothetical protein